MPKAEWERSSVTNVSLSLFALGRSFHHTSVEISIISHPYSSQTVSWNSILKSSKMHMSDKEVFSWGNLQLIFQKVNHLSRSLEEKPTGLSGCFSRTFNHWDYSKSNKLLCTVFFVESKPHPRRKKVKRNKYSGKGTILI